MTKNTYIRMRLTAEEKQEIREAAECDRTNMTDYILSLVHKEKTRMESKECMGCKQNAVDKYKRMTQADRIRAMSDDELAEFIEQVSTDSMETISFGHKEYEEIWEHKETVLQWLQSEVEEQHKTQIN